MSVLVKGMKMPQPGSYDGRLTVTSSGDALFYLFHEYGAYPAKEIPPHGRLIDADALLMDANKLRYGEGWLITMENIENAPTIIEAEVEE